MTRPAFIDVLTRWNRIDANVDIDLVLHPRGQEL